MKTIFIIIGGLLLGLSIHLFYYEELTDKPAREFSANLAWMEQDLHLSREQSARIDALHASYGPTFQTLFNKLAQTRQAAEKLEENRQMHNTVDFMVFFQVLEDQRKLEAESRDATHSFVTAVNSELTPLQKEKFMSLLLAAQ